MKHLYCILDGDVPPGLGSGMSEDRWHHFPGFVAGRRDGTERRSLRETQNLWAKTPCCLFDACPRRISHSRQNLGLRRLGERGWMSCFTVHPDIRQEGPWERRGSAHFFRMDMIGCFLFLAGGTRIDGVAGSKSGRLGGVSLEGWARLERSGGWAGRQKAGRAGRVATGAGRARRAGRDVAIAGQEDFGIWGAGETCGSCSRVLSSRSLT